LGVSEICEGRRELSSYRICCGYQHYWEQGDFWIVEFAGVLENKGKVRHKIAKFDFDVNALFFDDPVETRDEWGGQVHFPHKIIEGSFLPKHFKYFFIDPGVKARY
jgi:hypothetical protein